LTMAGVVSLIALDANDLRVFGEVLRYLSPPVKLSLRLHYPQSMEEPTRLSLPSLGFVPFPGAVPDADCAAPDHAGSGYYVFATQKSCLAWVESRREKVFPVWAHASTAIADMRGVDPAILLKQSFLDAQFMQVLRGEDQFPGDAFAIRPRRCKSFGSFLRQQESRSWLATRNGDMLEAWLDSRVAQCFLWYLGTKYTCLILRNPTDDAAFNLAYRQLSAFLAALAVPPAGSGLTWDKVRTAFEAASGSYGFFAEYYDKYMAHVCYNDWLDMILRWCKKFTDHPTERVLELACGTANISEQLVYQGYAVDACDLSPFMLHVAERKLFKPNLFRHDMATPLSLSERYDLILCLFDSINYVLDEQGFATMLRSAWLALKPGSLLVFDISTQMNSSTYFADTVQYSVVKDGYLVHRANYDALANRQSSRLTLFRKNGGCYHRFEEHHVQRVYRCEEIFRLLDDTPLELVGVFSPESRSNLLSRRHTDLDNLYPRLFFVLKKQ